MRTQAHPLAFPGNRSGALDMKVNDLVRVPDGRTGIVNEFLHDGDAFISFDDGTFGTVKWQSLTKLA